MEMRPLQRVGREWAIGLSGRVVIIISDGTMSADCVVEEKV